MTQHVSYYANGKLLLTGEYLIMDGATALALPVKYGQQLDLTTDSHQNLVWEASDVNGTWFEGIFSLPSLAVIRATDEYVGKYLQRLLQAAAELNSNHSLTEGCNIQTRLNYSRYLGLGSSSTVISLVARLFGVDKYKLHNKVSSGSGYDVACSDKEHPFLFTRKGDQAFIEPVSFLPPFHEHMYFIYLGNKQDTDKEILNYRAAGNQQLESTISEISNITRSVIESRELSTFVSLIAKHEDILSARLNRPGIKNMFPGFQGVLKSLGAWGGDFMLAVSETDEANVRAFFSKYNIEIIYRYNDLVLNQTISDNHGTYIQF